MAACLRCGKEVEGPRGGLLCPTCAADQPRVSVTLVLIAINVLVFIVMAAGGVSILEPTAEQLIRWGAGFGPYSLGTQPWRLDFSSPSRSLSQVRRRVTRPPGAPVWFCSQVSC